MGRRGRGALGIVRRHNPIADEDLLRLVTLVLVLGKPDREYFEHNRDEEGNADVRIAAGNGDV